MKTTKEQIIDQLLEACHDFIDAYKTNKEDLIERAIENLGIGVANHRMLKKLENGPEWLE
jgi:hypothetical protein